MIFLACLCLVCIAFLKLWDHRNQHIRFEEVIILKEERIETLDEMLFRLSLECAKEQKKLNSTESGTEQFTEMVEKYNRPNFDDEER